MSDDKDQLADDILPPDPDVDEQVLAEEELAEAYDDRDDHDRHHKVSGPGFSKQKKLMEDQQYYQGSNKPKAVIVKGSKKR